MVYGMDLGIGRVLNVLEEKGIRENTLIIFLSDNGGRAEHANNFPYRGHKGMLFEGGIRVPFCLSWPEKIKPGQSVSQVITGLDILPTAMSAANIENVNDIDLDGMNLLPLLNGEQMELNRRMFWRYSGGKGWVSREGKYKLIHSHYKRRTMLFDLDEDPFEHHDIADQHPDLVAKLIEAYKEWDGQLMKPLWEDPHIQNVENEEMKLQDTRKKARAGERN